MGFFGRSKKKQAPEVPTPKVSQLVSPEAQIPPPPSWHPQDRTHQAPAPGQSPGYMLPSPPPLPPSPVWTNTLPPITGPPPQYYDQPPYPPIVVNQHYYLGPPNSHPVGAQPYPYGSTPCAVSRLKLGSAVNLANEIIPGNIAHQFLGDGLPRWHAYGTQLLNQSAAMYDQICSSFNDVMTLIDTDKYTGNENDLFTYGYTPVPSALPETPQPQPQPQPQQAVVHKGTAKKCRKPTPKETGKGQTSALASTLASRGYFAKVELYANSKLSPNLPALRLYVLNTYITYMTTKKKLTSIGTYQHTLSSA